MKNQLKLTRNSAIGYILILLGLLFISLPLASRTVNDYKAKASEEEFKKEQVQRSSEEVATETENAKEYNEVVKNSDVTVSDPFTAEDYQTKYEKFTKTNVPFAYLSIPKIDKNLPLYLDATLDHLSNGVAHVDGTSIPIGGAGSRSVIAGHRGWWTDTMLLYVDQLQEGDYVYIQRAEETMRYVVRDKEVIGPYDWDKLAPRGDADIITLLTCSPFIPPRPNRLLVNCYRDESGIAEEFNLPGAKLPASESENSENTLTDKMVVRTRIITLGLAVLAIVLFLVTLIKFISRIKNTKKK